MVDWIQTVVPYLRERKELVRGTLESRLDLADTEYWRGYIAALKDVENLGKAKVIPLMPSNPDGTY